MKYQEAVNVWGLNHLYINSKKHTSFNYRHQDGYTTVGFVEGWYHKAWAVARKNRQEQIFPYEIKGM